ncbi:MAG: FecR family protein [Gammaproteobacteria bacterium]|nr:FecR family protein [Gammaproteobacteria bacterium]MDP2348936.1 FecR family protein [Gammaproteobacteria bacterium]
MNSGFHSIISTTGRRATRLMGITALFVFGHGAAISAHADELAGVGKVSLVLGKAYLESAGKPRQLIRSGTEIHVNDQIVTEANGHVHIRFVDSALVSVRPDSLLEIVRYDYDAHNPTQSSIKLNLVEGVTRAISGDGARSARERFRLNTPIAAIGVRGTDFVVSATGQSVRALVNEGAIVLAPYSSECLAIAFGPCAVNAVELTQESLQVVQLDGSTPLPRLVPAPDERGPLTREEVEIADVDSGAEEKTVGTGVYLETVTSRRVTEVASNTVVPPVKPGPGPVTPPVIRDYTPSAGVASSALLGQQMVWGRWTEGQGANERITLALNEAQQGRAVTISGSAKPVGFGNEYGLFRVETDGTRVAAGLGVVTFGLDTAQAFFHSETGVVAMQVNSGSLSVDFNQNNFSTQLGLNHATTGRVDFSAAGRISDGGYFHNNTDTQTMAGAVSIDGAEAGYYFEKQLNSGSVKGLTLWDKQ